MRLLHSRHDPAGGGAVAGLILGWPSEEVVRAVPGPNLCRCGTHMRILAAVKRAATLETTAEGRALFQLIKGATNHDYRRGDHLTDKEAPCCGRRRTRVAFSPSTRLGRTQEQER